MRKERRKSVRPKKVKERNELREGVDEREIVYRQNWDREQDEDRGRERDERGRCDGSSWIHFFFFLFLFLY